MVSTSPILTQFGTGGLKIYYILVLIIPGLIAIEIYLWKTHRLNEYGRIRATVFSGMFSLTSLFILYLLYPHYEPGLAFIAELLASRGTPSADEIKGFRLETITVLYIAYFGVIVLIGYVVGHIDYNYRQSEVKRDRREAWDYSFKEVYGGSEEIRVFTDDGTVYEGVKMEAAHSEKTRDILLSSPSEVDLSEVNDGEDISRTLNGRQEIEGPLYLTQGSIRKIEFFQDEEEDDPDREKEKGEFNTEVVEDVNNSQRTSSSGDSGAAVREYSLFRNR